MKPNLARLGLAAASLLVALGIGEFAVRVAEPTFFDVPYRAFHPGIGWKAPPDFVGFRKSGDRVIRYETTSDGFRDRDHGLQSRVALGGGKTAKIRRIVVIGDSFAEALQVDTDQTFWSILERNLNRSAGDYWEVINLGIGDFGTLQESMALRDFGLKYNPELVITQVFPLNDVFNNSILAANLASSQDAYRPYLDPRTDFSTVTYLNPTTNWLRARSHLLRQLFLVWNRKVGTWGMEMNFPDFASRMDHVAAISAELTGVDGSHEAYFSLLMNCLAPDEEQFAMVEQGWAATEAGLRRIEETAAGIGARSMLLVVPHTEQLSPRSEGWKRKFPYSLDRKYAEKRLSERFSGDETSVVALVSEFESRLSTVIPPLGGHFNPDTHILVAELLEARVRTVLGLEEVPETSDALDLTTPPQISQISQISLGKPSGKSS